MCIRDSSLAIGQRGQNVRLAARLTGWKIDVRGKEAVEKIKKTTKKKATTKKADKKKTTTKKVDKKIVDKKKK